MTARPPRRRAAAPRRPSAATLPQQVRRRRLWRLLAGGLAVGVLVAGAAEGVTRHVIEQRIAAAVHKRLSGPVDVGIGPTPALIDVVTRHFAKITVQAPSTSVCQLQAVDVSAAITDVHSSRGQEYAQGVDADAVITTTTISDLLAGKIANATITTNPSAGTLDIGIYGGLVQLDERASLDGDTVRFSPASVSIMGRPAPSSLQTKIDSRLTVQHSLSGLPEHLTPSSLTVTEQGIRVSLAAGPTHLDMGTPGGAAKPKCPAMKAKL
jgi:hypothetical protein